MVFSQKSILHQNHFSCQMDPKKNHFLAREHLYNHRSASWRAPLSVPPFSQIIQCLLHLFVANFISLFVYYYPPHLTLSSLFLSVALKGRMDSTDMRLMHVATLAGLLGVLGTIPYGPISCNNRIRRFLSLFLYILRKCEALAFSCWCYFHPYLLEISRSCVLLVFLSFVLFCL